MAKYGSCPGCGNTEKSVQLSQCKCGHIFCIKSGWGGGSGCGVNGCPRCGKKASDARRIGYIGM